MIIFNQNEKKQRFDYPCESHTDCYPIELLLPKGIYLFEAWGAQG